MMGLLKNLNLNCVFLIRKVPWPNYIYFYKLSEKNLSRPLHIVLVGNPNSGKSSLFNSLTGLNQKVSNFPGVTIDKKTGGTSLSTTLHAEVIDLPGTYSLYPRRMDEWVSYKVLLKQDKELKADVIVVVADASNL